MRDIWLVSLALPALIEGQAIGAKTQPAFAGVQGAFFALSVADAEASAKWSRRSWGSMIGEKRIR